MERQILHIDMNNFYASVECMLNPKLRSYPIAVCGDIEERHGIVLAKNYKAKAYGIQTGEPVWQAKRKCCDLVTVPPNFDEYIKASEHAREIYGRYTDRIEPFGMDEVWADVSGSTRLFGASTKIAEEIRSSIKAELGLTVSIGVSFNKVFAKLGSDMKKPDAITVITKESFREKVWPLPVSELLGVGKATYKKLAADGIRTIGTLAAFPPEFLRRRLGKCGVDLWRFANGLDDSPVTVRPPDVPDKSIGHGMTSIEDLTSPYEVQKFMLELTQRIGHKLYTYEKKAGGISITVKDKHLHSEQWQTVLPVPIQSPTFLAKEAFALFSRSYKWNYPIRAVTVTAINLISDKTPTQLDMFTDIAAIERTEALDRAIEELRARFGTDIIRNACLLENPKMPGHDNPKTVMPSAYNRKYDEVTTI